MASPEERLKAFQTENHISTRGPLSFVVQSRVWRRTGNFRSVPGISRRAERGRLPDWAARFG